MEKKNHKVYLTNDTIVDVCTDRFEIDYINKVVKFYNITEENGEQYKNLIAFFEIDRIYGFKESD